MFTYLLRRLIIAVPSLLGISVILFTILALAPGDPFSEMATNPNVPPEVREAIRASFGLNDPIMVRYVRWLSNMVQGDWGFSFASRINVDTLILQRVPTTLFLTSHVSRYAPSAISASSTWQPWRRAAGRKRGCV